MNTTFIKKFGIAMVAILIAVGFSAYKVGERVNSVNSQTIKSESKLNQKSNLNSDLIEWCFIGTDPLQSSNSDFYLICEETSIVCDDFPELVCKILAPANALGTQPDLSAIFDNTSIPQRSYGDMINEAMDIYNTNPNPTTNAVVLHLRKQ